MVRVYEQELYCISFTILSLCALIVCPPKVGWHVFQLRPWFG